MTTDIVSPAILGTGHQVEYIQQAEAAARLSGLASNAASLCHALAKGVDPGRLHLLIKRTRGFSELVTTLESGGPRLRSYSALIPYRVWRESAAGNLSTNRDRLTAVLAAIERSDIDQAVMAREAEHFRDLAAKLAERGKASAFAAQDL